MKLFGLSILFILILVLTTLFAAFLSGRIKRSYLVHDFSENITINDRNFQSEELAEKYKPLPLIRTTTTSPPLLWIWYEIIDNTDAININYYFNWENEINPNKSINIFYSIFRSAYFGYPLYDIEYFQIEIEKKAG